MLLGFAPRGAYPELLIVIKQFKFKNIMKTSKQKATDFMLLLLSAAFLSALAALSLKNYKDIKQEEFDKVATAMQQDYQHLELRYFVNSASK